MKQNQRKSSPYSNYEAPTGVESAYMQTAYRPTWADSVADEMSASADNQDMPAMTKIALRGFAGGMKGAANQERYEKTKWLEDQIKTMLEHKAIADNAVFEEETRKNGLMKFSRRNAGLLRESVKALTAGDINSADKLFGQLFNEVSQVQGSGFEGLQFDHISKDGVAVFKDNENRGRFEGFTLADLVNQLDDAVDLTTIYGADAAQLKAMVSPGYKREYENQLMMEDNQLRNQDLQNRKLEGEISHGNLKQELLQRQLAMPQDELPEEARKINIQSNAKYLNEELPKQMEQTSQELNAYKQIVNLVEQNPDIAGSNWIKEGVRFFRKISGMNKAEQELELAKANFLPGIKKLFGSVISDYDQAIFAKTLLDFEKHPEVVISVGKRRIQELTNKMQRYNMERDVIARNPHKYKATLDEEIGKQLNQGQNVQGSGMQSEMGGGEAGRQYRTFKED